MKIIITKDPSQFNEYSKQGEEMKSYEQDPSFSDLLEIIMNYLHEHPNDAPRLRKMLKAYISIFFED